MESLTRRDVLVSSGLAVGATFLPQAKDQPKKLKIIIAGGHPDDPESGCGGTATRFADLGHEVANLYLTRGEAGIRGKTHAEAAAIRTAEIEKACEILKVRPRFAGQIDGATEINPARYDEFRKILDDEKPDAVFTHWPIDTHRDHRAMSYLVYDAWIRGKKFALYYFEVNAGSQTQHFRPTHYVNITAIEARKREACMAHASQDPNGFYSLHEAMHKFRGMEAGVKFAEAFIRHAQSREETLP